MGINNYIQNLKEKSQYNMKINSMSIEELQIEKKRLTDLKSTYDSWGSAHSINSERYRDVSKLLATSNKANQNNGKKS